MQKKTKEDKIWQKLVRKSHNRKKTTEKLQKNREKNTILNL
jgi:hypothetical protein